MLKQEVRTTENSCFLFYNLLCKNITSPLPLLNLQANGMSSLNMPTDTICNIVRPKMRECEKNMPYSMALLCRLMISFGTSSFRLMVGTAVVKQSRFQRNATSLLILQRLLHVDVLQPTSQMPMA